MPEIPFGPYTLVRRLAVGGMAEVFAARDADGAAVVVKQILPQLAEDPQLVQMFLDEARIASGLDHRGIVSVLDYGRIDGTYYLTMELVDGVDLSALLRRTGPLPLPVAMSVMIDLAEALHHAHTASDATGQPLNIVHRDVSPQNVLLSGEGDVKLADFGIARAANRAVQTATGVLRGKVAYLAPEVFGGAKATPRSDVYALGVVLYEALAGRRPFEGEDAAVIRSVMGAAPQALSTLADVPAAVNALVMKAMAKAPEDRPASSAAMAEALIAVGARATEGAVGALVRTARALDPAHAKRGPATQTLPGALGDETEPEVELDGGEAAAAARRSGRPGSVGGPPPARVDPAVTARVEPSSPIGSATAHPSSRRLLSAGLLALIGVLGVLVGIALRPETTAPVTAAHEVTVLKPSAPETTPPTPGASEAPALATPTAVDPRAAAVGTPEPVAAATGTPGPAAAAGTPRLGAENAAVGPDLDSAVSADAPTARETTVEAQTVSAAPKKRRRSAKKRRKPRPRARAAASAPGELSLDTTPWSYVSIGGTKLGATPIAHVEVRAGRRRVRLRNPAAGVDRTVTIRIRPGRHTAARVELTSGAVTYH